MNLSSRKAITALLVACAACLPLADLGAIGIRVGIPSRSHASAVIQSVDFTTLTPGAVTLPAWLSFSRASAATVQTGTSTVVTSGIGTDVARAGRRLDADSVGLVFEEARTNAVADSRNFTSGSNGWQPKGATATLARSAGTCVDGAGTVNEISTSNVSVTSFGPFNNGAALPSGARTSSAWVRTHGGGAGYNQIYSYDGTSQVSTYATISGSWSRVSVFQTAVATGGQFNVASSQDLSATGGQLPAGTLDNDTDLAQVENGKWASETIVTSGASATRAGERLYVATGASLIPNGRLAMSVSLRPKGSSQQYSAPMFLWRVDASNYASISNTTGVMAVAVGGVIDTTDALSWSQYDSLDVYVAAGGSQATEVYWRVNGGTTHVGVITGSALGTVTAGGALDVLCNSTAGQFSGWVTSLSWWKNRDVPAWAR